MKTKWHEKDDYKLCMHGRKWAMSWIRAGIATDFLDSIDAVLADDGVKAVVLYARVSTKPQEQSGNLRDSLRYLRREARRRGFLIVGEFSEVAKGSDLAERIELPRAIACARAHRAVVLAESRCRYIRHEFFSGTNSSDQPTIAEFRSLRRMADGVLLTCLLPPNQNARSAQVKRGQVLKGRKGGRPRKSPHDKGETKLRRERYIFWAAARRDSGWSHRRIAEELSHRSRFRAPTPKTVFNWLKRSSEGV